MMIPLTTYGGCELGLSNRQNDHPTSAVAKYNGRDIVTLPKEILNKTFFSNPQYGFNVSQTNGVISADSPDGKHRVTASGDTAKIFELNDEQWQEKATIEHHGRVNDACFSFDGKRFVTVADNTAKICELNDEQWQEKATIVHRACVSIARFSEDGERLMTVSCDNTGKIFGVSDGLWQDETTTKHDL